MNSGYCFFDGEMYVKHESDAFEYVKKLGYDSLNEAYLDGVYYWTQWDS